MGSFGSYYKQDFRERDAALAPLYKRLSLAKAQRNKLSISLTEKEIANVFKRYW